MRSDDYEEAHAELATSEGMPECPDPTLPGNPTASDPPERATP